MNIPTDLDRRFRDASYRVTLYDKALLAALSSGKPEGDADKFARRYVEMCEAHTDEQAKEPRAEYERLRAANAA